MKTTVIALALLLTGCGGGPQATAPTAPAVPANPTATAPPAAAPAAPAEKPVDTWGTLALAGASMVAENPGKACDLIRQAAQLRATAPAPADEAEAAAAQWGAEALQTHGPRCGVS